MIANRPIGTPSPSALNGTAPDNCGLCVYVSIFCDVSVDSSFRADNGSAGLGIPEVVLRHTRTQKLFLSLPLFFFFVAVRT